MARGQRKPASDSLEAVLAAARQPDLSAIPLPDIEGMNCLTSIGRQFFEDVWRSDPDHFPAADLAMLVEASAVYQAMAANRMVCVMTPPTQTLSNGVVARSPSWVAQAELTRTFQTLMRDLSIRSKDGFKPASKSSPPATKTSTSDNVTSFEDFLNGGD